MLTAEHNPYAKLIKSASLGTDIRLRVYEPDGETTRGIVSDALEIEVYDRQGQTPTLTVKATAHTPSTRHLLAGPCIVAVEVMLRFSDDLDHFSYNELRNMRFVIMDVSHDRSLASDPTDTYTFKGVGMLHLFEGARVMLDPQPQPEGDEEQVSQKAEKRSFIDATPGSIVWTLYEEARARGELLPLQLGFDAETDSFGNPWPTVSREYSPSTSLRTVISNMLESGLAEFWMHQGVLYMALIDEWDRHFRQTAVPVPYIRDLTPDSAPETTAYSDLISRVLLIGDEGYTREKWVQPNPQLMPFGARTMVLEAGGVSTDEDADRMIDRALAEGSGATRTYTRDWTYAGDQSPMGYLPFRDFNPGDWLNCDIDGEPRAKMQVRDMSLKRSGAELKASVTLGSLRDDLLTRLARQAQALSDGAAVASTGRPKPVAGGGEYDAHPGQKKGLKVTDKAGGLRAYSDTYESTDNGTVFKPGGLESIAVDKDTGAVRLNGTVRTEALNFFHTTSDAGSARTYNYLPTSDTTSNGMGHFFPRKIDGVMNTSWSANSAAAVGAYHREGDAHAVLGVVHPGADWSGQTAGVGAIATANGTAVTVSGDKVYLDGEVHASSTITAKEGVNAEEAEVRAGSLIVTKKGEDANHIHGDTKFWDNVEVKGKITMSKADIPVVKSGGRVPEAVYPLYLTASGLLIRGSKPATQPI